MAKHQTSRDRQAAATKGRIYRCGVRLMNRYGYDHVTVGQIAEKAGVSVGTFYHHFKSKLDLLGEVFRQGDAYFTEYVPRLMRDPMRCAQRIEEYFARYAALALQNGLEMVRSLYVPTNRMFLTHGRAMQDLLTEILRIGQQGGEVTPEPDAAQITEMLFVVARGVIFDWCLHDGQTDLAAQMRDTTGRYARSFLLR